MTHSIKGTICALAFAAVSATAATAGTVTYEVTDFNGDRGLWTDNMVQSASGDNLGREYSRWSLSDSYLTVDSDGVGVFSGTATNNGDSNIGLDFEINLALNPTSTNTGYCQFGGAPFNCATGTPSNWNNSQDPFDTSSWEYYDFLGGSLIGFGEMEGVTYSINDVSSGQHLPQVGVGANAFDRDDLGFSTWFSWELEGENTNTSSTYSFLSSSSESANGHGDFNVDLTLAPVPLPASLPLLALSLLGAGYFGRRKSAQA